MSLKLGYIEILSVTFFGSGWRGWVSGKRHHDAERSKIDLRAAPPTKKGEHLKLQKRLNPDILRIKVTLNCIDLLVS